MLHQLKEQLTDANTVVDDTEPADDSVGTELSTLPDNHLPLLRRWREWLTLKKNRLAFAIVWHTMDHATGWHGIVSCLLTAITQPDKVFARYERQLRTEHHQLEMQKCWQKAYPFIRQGNRFWRFQQQWDLSDIYLQLGDQPYSLPNLCGFYINGMEFSAATASITNAERQQILVDIGRAYFKNPDIDLAVVFCNHDGFNGHTDYKLAVFTEVDAADIPADAQQFIKEISYNTYRYQSQQPIASIVEHAGSFHEYRDRQSPLINSNKKTSSQKNNR